MNIYDKNGKHIGELFDGNDAGPEGFVAAIVLAVAFVLVGMLSKWFGIAGYYIGAVPTAIFSIWLWFKYAIPSIKDSTYSRIGEVVLPIIASIIAVPIIIVVIGLISDLAANVFVGWEDTPFISLVVFW